MSPVSPVWIVDTPANASVVLRMRPEWNAANHLVGITTFIADPSDASAEDLLISQIDSIDLHLGSFSASPPYTTLEVFGATLTEAVKGELSAYGFDEFQMNSEGFTATRPAPKM